MIRTPGIIKNIFSNVHWGNQNKGKYIYFTFDDGPIPEVTPWVLDQLKEFNAQATFFCVGENIKKNPLVFQRILNEGHSIGNHTYNHLDGWKTENKQYLKNVLKCDEVIDSFLFRPPYGRLTPAQFRLINNRLNLQVVLWDILSEDYNTKISPQKCLDNVVNYAKPGDIVVFHDSLKAQKNLKYALPKSLEILSKEGYQFLPLQKRLKAAVGF